MTEHFITLSTTEPNNNIGIVKLRHADVNSQAIVARIVENGQPKNFEGLQPFFCLMAQEVTGQGVSEEAVISFDATKGILTYIASDNALQMVGRNEAYFSFRKQEDERWIEQFSTRTFNYIVEKSIYSQPFKDSNYWWTFKELNRIFNQYIEDGKNSWEDFVNQNKEILESVDPGGKILSELLAARNGKPNLKTRIDDLENETTAQLAQTNLFVGEKVNAKEFGFVTDAVGQNDTLFDEFFSNPLYKNKTLYFPSGLYLFNKWHDIKDNFSIEMDLTTELRLMEAQLAFITVGYFKTGSFVQDDNFLIRGKIKGGTINGNNLCDVTLGTNWIGNGGLHVDDIVINGFKRRGFYTGYRQDTSVNLGGGNYVNRARIHNTSGSISGTWGIYDDGSDNYFDNIITQDVQCGVYTRNGMFGNIHPWISKPEWYAGSVAASIDGNGSMFERLMVDTVETVFRFMGSGELKAVAAVNILVYNNVSVSTGDHFLFQKHETVTGRMDYSISNLISRNKTNMLYGGQTISSLYGSVTNVVGDTSGFQTYSTALSQLNNLGNLFSKNNLGVTDYKDLDNHFGESGIVYVNQTVDTGLGVFQGIALTIVASSDYGVQIIFHDSALMRYRIRIKGSLSAWKNIISA
ncbi:phage baseplate upper protein [Lactococcus lactis]|uniref:Phage baseplate upper protein n=1 Tax=Lactococcus lactis TaxID=1358 RepID=A0A9X4NAV7_9LACT|nr:phage baseplate upper protein [Lactococcus lactis]MDG4980279.1 phage baseplate upper protein [Lactococcus lactis]